MDSEKVAETARGILSRVGSDLAEEIEKDAVDSGEYAWAVVARDESGSPTGFGLLKRDGSETPLMYARPACEDFSYGELVSDGENLDGYMASRCLGPYGR